MVQIVNIVLGGVFHAALLFLVAAGLQLVFGVQKVINLACGAFYALGAYFGISAAKFLFSLGWPQASLVPILVLSGALLALLLGPIFERLLRTIYGRDEHFQLLLTFAFVLMIEDAIRFLWGTSPQQLGNVYLVYGQIPIGAGITIPTYNFIVIVCAALIAALTNWLIVNSRFGGIVRATAENRRMAAAIGVDTASIYVRVFTLGTALGTIGGALAIPSSAATIDLGIELIVDAFAVVIIGGLGSMVGAFFGALIVGLLKAAAIATYPELEMLAIYLIVVVVLVVRPTGLAGRVSV
jgi:branched-chain amino acid transport system permease protein